MGDAVVNKTFRNVGGTRGFTVRHIGPASYVQVANAGADVLQLGPGLNKGTLYCSVGVDSSGIYAVYPIIPAGDTKPQLQTIKLKWVVISTGAEVTAAVNLSALQVRFRVETL